MHYGQCSIKDATSIMQRPQLARVLQSSDGMIAISPFFAFPGSEFLLVTRFTAQPYLPWRPLMWNVALRIAELGAMGLFSTVWNSTPFAEYGCRCAGYKTSHSSPLSDQNWNDIAVLLHQQDDLPYEVCSRCCDYSLWY
jgi:hypothetical protein